MLKDPVFALIFMSRIEILDYNYIPIHLFGCNYSTIGNSSGHPKFEQRSVQKQIYFIIYFYSYYFMIVSFVMWNTKLPLHEPYNIDDKL